MFEDIDDQKPTAADHKKLVVTRDANDRALVYAIWTRNATGGMPPHEAWLLLHDRYPEDGRFLLLNTYEEVVAPATSSSSWSPSELISKVRRVLDTSGGRLNPEVRDLLVVAEDDLHPLSEDDSARLDRIRARVSSRSGDPAAARKRLQRLASDVVRELHDRTTGGKPIGRTSGSIPAAAAATDWKTQLASATGTRSTYSATAKMTAGDVVEHPKFGPGVVVGVEPGRAHILFESGARKLVAG